jgi:hypothetical protein
MANWNPVKVALIVVVWVVFEVAGLIYQFLQKKREQEMKIYSLHPDESHTLPPGLIEGPAGFCYDCHNRARWLVLFDGKRPQIRLCNCCVGL